MCSYVKVGSTMPFVVSFWREKNDTCFEDREKMVVKLKSFFFKTLSLWIVALDFYLPSFHDFLSLFSLSS